MHTRLRGAVVKVVRDHPIEWSIHLAAGPIPREREGRLDARELG